MTHKSVLPQEQKLCLVADPVSSPPALLLVRSKVSSSAKEPRTFTALVPTVIWSEQEPTLQSREVDPHKTEEILMDQAWVTCRKADGNLW